MLYFLSGLCGITLYFLLENTALLYTYSSNAALLVTASPLFTVLIASFIIKTHAFSKLLLIACVMALVGVALVLANQPMSLTNGMLGNILAILSGLAWSFFGFANSAIKDELSPMVRMRKVFLYGIITASLYMLVTGEAFINLHAFTPMNLANLLFLGGIASALCFVLWTNANKHLGVVKTSLYIYFIPLIAVLLGVVLLGETITISTILGGILIALAVFLANCKKSVS
ncbi:DMT family transporter [Faucicola osloensis]|uniref:DMT family transporter n=1 Tax=Faucicola osloensis TaxID=34062 RepID=UPI003F6A222F